MPAIKSSQVKSSQVKSSQVKSSQVESSQVESSQVESNQVESDRVESSQVKSSQVEVGAEWPSADRGGRDERVRERAGGGDGRQAATEHEQSQRAGAGDLT